MQAGSEQTYLGVTVMSPTAAFTAPCVLRPMTTSSNANAARAAEILTYLFIIFPFHGCLVSGPAEDGEGGLWATPGLRTPVAPTGLGHQGPALERVPHRLTQSRRFVRLSVNAGWPPPFGSNTTNGVSPAAPALAKILSIARYLPRDPIGSVSPIGLVKNHPRSNRPPPRTSIQHGRGPRGSLTPYNGAPPPNVPPQPTIKRHAPRRQLHISARNPTHARRPPTILPQPPPKNPFKPRQPPPLDLPAIAPARRPLHFLR